VANTSLTGIRCFSGKCAFATLPSKAYALSPRKNLGESAFAS
jgi:hypothetical protein